MSVTAVNAHSTGIGTGAATEFPFTFVAMTSAEVAVYLDGILQENGYSVELGDSGGTVTFTTAPDDDAEVLIVSSPLFTQGISFADAGQFLPSSHDDALDRAAVRDIWLRDRSNRSLRAPAGETMDDLPSAADRAGKFQTFDAEGNPTATASTGGADSALRTDLAASGGSALASFLQSGTGAVSRSVQTKLRDMVSVKDFGAVGDGVTNDRAAFALAATAARGKRVVVPKGNYLLNTDGGSITLEELDLVGEGVLDGATGLIDQGANLWITGTVNSPFKVRRGVSISSLGIYYPNQSDNAVATSYPATFAFDFTDGAVQFVHIHGNVVYNAYKFIDIDDATGNVGHVEISGNYICALNRAIYVRHNLEHIRVERNNFTFGHWLEATEGGSRAYMRANATALKVDQSDGIEFIDNLVFGHLNGMLTSATGLCQFMHVSLNKFDQARFGIKATGTGRFDGSISNNTFNCFNSQNTALQGRCVHIDTSGAGNESVTIGGNNFDLATEDAIYIAGNTPTRYIAIGPNSYRSWAAYKVAGAYGAINASGAITNVQVTGGWFFGAGSAAYSNGIMGSLNTLQVTGAKFDFCLVPVNVTATHVTLTGNRSFNTGGSTSDTVTATSYRRTGNEWDKPSAISSTISTATYTVKTQDSDLNFSNACTITLPSAATANAPIWVRTATAAAIISASSNVVPLAGGAAGTAILAATAGKWAKLVPVGSNWQIMAAN